MNRKKYTMPSLRFSSIRNDHYVDNNTYRIHLVCPLQMAPFHRTRLFTKGESVEVCLEKGPFYVVLHAYEGQRLAGREVSEVVLNSTQNKASFSSVSVSLELTDAQPYEVDNAFRAGIANATERLSQYVKADLERLQAMQPREEQLKHVHSVYYEFPLRPKLFVPYVALAGRLGPSLTCTALQLNDWQSFFIRELPIAMRECAVSPASFIATCRNQPLNEANLFFLYNSVAVALSRLVASRLSYAKDIEATFMSDYVGFNLVGNQIVGDCEDGSQLLYDVLRILRNIFPVTQKDLSRGQTSLCYYVAHLLNKAEVWMLQGAVDKDLGAHVWCAIMPHSGPVHFVESTGLPETSFYKYINRAWQLDHAGHFSDNLMVNPSEGVYGLPCQLLTNVKADGLAIFRRYAVRNRTPINEDLKFANLIDAPLMHPMDVLQRKFS